MKKLIAPAWLTAWLMGWLPDRMFKAGRKTPWYRQSLMADLRIIGGILAVPLLALAIWQGVRMFSQKATSESQ